MSFSKNLTISVRNTAAQLSEPLYVYEKDRNLIMYFKIMDHKYKFDKNPTNVLASMDDVMSAYVIIVDPNGYELTHQNGEVIDDEIKFVITDELIDEITEIGTYQLQFHIKCECSEFTIPPISFEVLERLKGIKSVIDESEVGDVITNDSESFIDEEGKLQIVWQKGDTISSVKLNQMVEVVNNAVDEEHLRKLNEQERVDKENERVTKENERIANEDVRTANENVRVTSESTRIANEDERKSKETLRQSEENKRQTNEQTRIQNEENRVTAENARVDKENERVTKENKRQNNEDTRTANENARVTSESTRLSNEAGRIANEDERKSKETLRQSEENKRQTNEQTRIQNEENRVTAENARVDKENERVTKENKRQNNEQTRIQNEENRVTAENARVASMSDITTRFNDLIASLPQYPEVIDARDGEVSLKARLDRDIEKAKQVYVNVEGSYITTDSSDGYAKDVEILGNTLMNLFNYSTPFKTHWKDITLRQFNPNTVYTFIVDTTKEADTLVLGILDASKNNWSCLNESYSTGYSVFKLTTDSDPSDTIRLGTNTPTTTPVTYNKILILEGDHTQNPPKCYFEGIRSVGDKVEGQELYEIPVLSCGKNLLDNDKLVEGHWISKTTGDFASDTTWKATEEFIEILPNQEYTIITEIPSGTNPGYALYDTTKRYISGGKNGYFVTPSNAKYLRLTVNTGKTAMLCLGNVSMSEPYEPYVEDKPTILSPVQLEKVGDVADRIVCKDGVWGVEKNVETKIFNGSEKWVRYWNGQKYVNCYSVIIPDIEVAFIISDKFKYGENAWDNESEDCMSGHPAGRIYVAKQDIASESDFKQWLQANPTTVKYQTTQPQFIPLPHDQQIKLRTFANKTNISFLTEIEGTIKAQVPKSLGATVNTHTEQISNLNKELDRVKKLEESTVSTVETESDFTTVEATSNGYFEDVKLEGKTLVNLFKCNTNLGLFVDNTIDKNRFKQGKYTVACLNDKPVGVEIKRISDNGWVHNYTIKPNQGSILIELSENCYIADIYGTVNNGWTESNISELFKTIILEGDHTQNPPSYFEGIKSVGQNVDEVSVNSVKGNSNLVDAKILTENVGDSFIILNYNTNTIKPKGTSWPFIHIPAYKKGKKYRLKMNISIPTKDTGLAFNLATTKSNYPNDGYGNIYTNSNCPESINMIIDGNGTGYWLRGNSNNIYSNISLTFENVDIQEFSTLKQDKKRLLYYNNETQAWEKPVLRQWDSIEKHADGKYYYHQRSGEVVLNGSENWDIIHQDTNTFLFSMTKLSNMKYVDENTIYLISDKFSGINAGNWYLDSETIHLNSQHLQIRINKTKLTTQDVQGFKQWLQANNVTVVYQLAQEKVYECTNIDLITYSGETNFILESGAIVPKTTLKVHNNISNIVSLLQKKVSVLESNITVMFRAVLAGDYQTLAYSLYPGDFNNRE